MQIITAVGLRQFVVLPFGVTNGPPYFQEAMLDLYHGASRKLPCLLGESMSEHDAVLEVFVDDITIGTGHGSTLVSYEIGSKDLDASAGSWKQYPPQPELKASEDVCLLPG